ncbi:hypothetical protein PspS49_28740 [Pseudomonas sp. S49]|nr:hypothetical protein PspS49_28740 [Pseudomonas sp. S49]
MPRSNAGANAHGSNRRSAHPEPDRSHALRGNASPDALRPLLGRGASLAVFPRGAWERSG